MPKIHLMNQLLKTNEKHKNLKKQEIHDVLIKLN